MPDDRKNICLCEPTNYISTVLFCSFVIYLYTQIGARSEFLGKIRFELIAGCLLIVYIIFNPKEYSLDSNIHKLYIMAGMLYILVAVMVLFSIDRTTSVKIFIDKYLKLSFVSLIIIYYVDRPKHLQWFIIAYLFACFYVTQDSFKSVFGYGDMIWENQGVLRLHGTTGNYEHPNSLAAFSIGPLPFIYYLLKEKISWHLKTFLYILAITATGCVIYTASRTAYLGIIVMMLTIIALAKKKIKIIFAMLFVCVLILFSIPSQYIERFETIYTMKDKEGRSIDTRIQIFEDALIVFKEHPFGIGVGAFPKIRYEKFGRIQDTHNLYLEVAINLGVQGLVIFSVMMIACIRCVLITRKKTNEIINKINTIKSNNINNKSSITSNEEMDTIIQDAKYIIAICNSLLSFIFIRLAIGFFGSDFYDICWWFILGLVIATRKIYLAMSRSVVVRFEDQCICSPNG